VYESYGESSSSYDPGTSYDHRYGPSLLPLLAPQPPPAPLLPPPPPQMAPDMECMLNLLDPQVEQVEKDVGEEDDSKEEEDQEDHDS
jgi:hypothetical protein